MTRPVIFPCISDTVPAEFTEIGYGENTDEQPDKENAYLADVICKQAEDMQFLNDSERVKIRDMLLRHKEAFGCKYSQLRMSKLTPLELELRDDAPQSITAAGRPQGHEKA